MRLTSSSARSLLEASSGLSVASPLPLARCLLGRPPPLGQGSPEGPPRGYRLHRHPPPRTTGGREGMGEPEPETCNHIYIYRSGKQLTPHPPTHPSTHSPPSPTHFPFTSPPAHPPTHPIPSTYPPHPPTPPTIHPPTNPPHTKHPPTHPGSHRNHNFFHVCPVSLCPSREAFSSSKGISTGFAGV